MPSSRRPSPDPLPPHLLRDGVARGIITQAQHDALLDLAASDLAASDLATSAADTPPPPVEAARGFNAVTIAYSVGGIAVLFAFGWILIDRWDALGAVGVLGVALLYAAIFGGTAAYLRRAGFRVAAGVATVLAVEMTPLATWALLDLAGLWPSRRSAPLCDWYSPIYMECNGKWIVIELASIGAALVALRRVHFSELAAPIGVALVLLSFHLVEAVFGTRQHGLAFGCGLVVAASLILSLAYATDRRQGEEDYAAWLYLAGLVTAFAAAIEVWEHGHAARHAVPIVALLAVAASLYLRRRAFLAFGAVLLVWYLGYLAFDVFRGTLAFPLLLATFGIAVIILTVILQRSYPRLAMRIDAREGREGRRLPGGHAALLAPAVIALLMVPGALARDGARAEEQRIAERRARAEAARVRRRGPPRGAATTDSLAGVPPASATAPATAPAPARPPD
jgi:hypothetical protein